MFVHPCKLGYEGIVSKQLGVAGRTKDWLKFKNPAAPAVKREAEEDWGRGGGGDDANARAIPIRAKHVVQRS